MDVLRTNWIITAISDFVIMYTTQLWVFTGGLTQRGGHAPCCSLMRAYCTCLRYHFGASETAEKGGKRREQLMFSLVFGRSWLETT